MLSFKFCILLVVIASDFKSRMLTFYKMTENFTWIRSLFLLLETLLFNNYYYYYHHYYYIIIISVVSSSNFDNSQ